MNDFSAKTFRKTFLNGYIFTVNENQPLAEAVITQENKITFVGGNVQAKSFINSETQVIDLKGKMMLPGFIDNHVHFINGGFQLLGVDLRKAMSTSEFKNILREYIAKNNNQWITGGDWDASIMGNE